MIVEYWENGKLKQRPATHEEEISHTEWHKSKQFRIILNLECLRILNLKKEFNDDINQLYAYFKSTELEKIEVNDSLIIYVDEIYPKHRMLIEQNLGIIEQFNS